MTTICEACEHRDVGLMDMPCIECRHRDQYKDKSEYNDN